MEALRGQSVHAPQRAWPAEVARLLEQHHLAAWAESPAERAAFAATLTAFLAGIKCAQVVPVFGHGAQDLEGLCYHLERSIPGAAPMRRRIHGPMGLVARLRAQDHLPGRPLLHTRYILWHDPDTLIERDEDLFARIADAIAGVAAEAEFASDDTLLVTRALYIGGRSLEGYAQLESGQLRSWLRDGSAEPFWRAATGIEAPPVLAAPLRNLLEDPASIADEMLLGSVRALML